MDHTYAIYQLQTQVWNLTLADWKSNLMSFKYWGVVAFILLYYRLWWKLTDKRHISDLLLFGSLLAVTRLIIDLLGVSSGLWLYTITILPTSSSVFLHVLTISPLTHMLAQQHSSNWKQFFIYGAIAASWICFVLLPIFSLLDIYRSIQWNYILNFLISYSSAIFARFVFHLIKQVQQKAIEGYENPLQAALMQPAFKPMRKDDES